MLSITTRAKKHKSTAHTAFLSLFGCTKQQDPKCKLHVRNASADARTRGLGYGLPLAQQTRGRHVRTRPPNTSPDSACDLSACICKFALAKKRGRPPPPLRALKASWLRTTACTDAPFTAGPGHFLRNFDLVDREMVPG